MKTDQDVRCWLQKWPQLTNEFGDNRFWLRSRPKPEKNHPQHNHTHPQLLTAGVPNSGKKQPDGLYVAASLNQANPYADVISIESCGDETNYLSKKAFYAPSNIGKVIRLDHDWLAAQVNAPKHGPKKPRWEWLDGATYYEEIPSRLILPIRRLRVVYALPPEWAGKDAYSVVQQNMLANGVEFYLRISQLKSSNWGNLAEEFFERLTNDSLSFYR